MQFYELRADQKSSIYCFSLFNFYTITDVIISAYGFYLTEDATLDSATSPLSLIVYCMENLVENSAVTYTGTIQLYITDNQPPTITNLDGLYIVLFLTLVKH